MSMQLYKPERISMSDRRAESLLSSEKGVALITALIFTVIGLAMIITTIYMTTRGTRVSGAVKSYKTAVEAAYGASDIFTSDILPRKIMGTNFASLTYGGKASYGDEACFDVKLVTPTALWGCGSSTFNPKDSPDMTLTLTATGGGTFNAFVKIVDTTSGNTDIGGLDLDALGVVDSNTTIITPQHTPYLYRMEIQGERQTNPDERMTLSVLYAY